MSETPDTAPAKKRAGGLSSMLIADLKSMAVGMGISGASTMKKAQLVDAIKAAQSSRSASAEQPRTEKAPRREPAKAQAPQEADSSETPAQAPVVVQRQRRGKQQDAGSKQDATPTKDGGPKQDAAPTQDRGAQTDEQPSGDKRQGDDKSSAQQGNKQGKDRKGQGNREQGNRDQGNREQGNRDQAKQSQSKQDRQNQRDQNQRDQNTQAQANPSQQPHSGPDDDGDDEGGSRRSRRRRGRERTTGRTGGRNEPDTTILEDDVLVPAAGILDVLENYAFVRTSGYLPGTEDVYLSLSMVKKYGLRRGDAIVGQVRQPREGERREKFNPMVRIDQVNGAEPDAARERLEFEAATPVHPAERLRLETTSDALVGRVVDIAAPVGKGQRTLVLAPAKSGKTVLLQEVAKSITANNPECHLMVVLVDERPEEVTDFQRSIKGEVIASTFDRPASDHVLVAELAVERAKRLVELGHDVVILLDSLTRLTRAYNQTVTASGRDLPGGLEPTAVHAAKRVFGAGRNIEDGGSLTVLATLSADSGSILDEAICEELLGTATSELRLDRELAAAATFPAVDVRLSATRREDVLLGEQEAGILHALRRRLAGTDAAAASAEVLDGLATTRTNIEFLTRVQRTKN